MLIDILHVDDHPFVVRAAKNMFDSILEKQDYPYQTFSNLEEFRKYMAAGNTSRLYFIDGTFKKTPDLAKTEFLFPGAVQIIRARDPSAKIWLFSLEQHGAKLAQRYQTGFIDKASNNARAQFTKIFTQANLIPGAVPVQTPVEISI